MEITFYFYQNTANSCSGSNFVTIRMWWAMIFFVTAWNCTFHSRLGSSYSLGRGERMKNPANASVSPWKKKWWYIIWNKNVLVSYSNLIQELWYFSSCRNESKQHYINKPAIESTKRCKIIFHLRQMVKLSTFCKSLPATGLFYVIHCWLLPHNIWRGNIKNISGRKNKKNPSVFNEF